MRRIKYTIWISYLVIILVIYTTFQNVGNDCHSGILIHGFTYMLNLSGISKLASVFHSLSMQSEEKLEVTNLFVSKWGKNGDVRLSCFRHQTVSKSPYDTLFHILVFKLFFIHDSLLKMLQHHAWLSFRILTEEGFHCLLQKMSHCLKVAQLWDYSATIYEFKAKEPRVHENTCYRQCLHTHKKGVYKMIRWH